MIELIKKVCKDIFTGVDGESYHMAKFSWAGSMVAICASLVHTAWLGHAIDYQSAGIALGTICTAHSAAIWGMKTQEPTGANNGTGS